MIHKLHSEDILKQLMVGVCSCNKQDLEVLRNVSKEESIQRR